MQIWDGKNKKVCDEENLVYTFTGKGTQGQS